MCRELKKASWRGEAGGRRLAGENQAHAPRLVAAREPACTA